MVPSSGVFHGSSLVHALGPVIAMSEGTFGDLTDLEKKIVSLVADHAPDSKLALLRRRFDLDEFFEFECISFGKR